MNTSSNPPWLPGLPPGLTLRREEGTDRDLARRIYAANRMAELALLPWPPAAKASFLADQFDAQSRHLANEWPRADRFVILHHGTPVGRFYVGRTRTRWHLVEIGLLPEGQRRGIGTALIAALQKAVATAGAPILELQVARDNDRAAALYARQGFVEIESPSPTHRAMRWEPAGASAERIRLRRAVRRSR